VRIEPGSTDNVGVIELTIIPEAATGGATLASAMRLVENTDALIFDLRPTRGGSPDGVAFLSSYPDGDVHLIDVVEGPSGPTRQYWTSAYVPGSRYLVRPAYVLTSASTFSGGEALLAISLTDHIELRLPVALGQRGHRKQLGRRRRSTRYTSEALDVARGAALRAMDLDPAPPGLTRVARGYGCCRSARAPGHGPRGRC
jgi:Peptidase family S41